MIIIIIIIIILIIIIIFFNNNTIIIIIRYIWNNCGCRWKLRMIKTRQDDLFNLAQFYMTYRLGLHRQQGMKEKNVTYNKIGSELGSSK